MKPLLYAALIIMLFTSQAAFAGDSAATNPVEDKIANTSFSYGIDAGYGVRLWGSDRNIDMPMGAVHIAFPLMKPIGSSWYRGVLEYKVELQGGVITDFDDRAFVGLTPVGLRYNFTGAGKHVPYVEGALGVSYLDVPRYVQGTTFNFTEMAGVGVRYFLRPGMAVNVEARYMHISNSGIREPNEGINEGYLMLGMSFY